MNMTMEILTEKLATTEKTLTTLEIVSSVLGVLFISSEIIGKSKCKANSLLGWIASWFNNISKCNSQEPIKVEDVIKEIEEEKDGV